MRAAYEAGGTLRPNDSTARRMEEYLNLVPEGPGDGFLQGYRKALARVRSFLDELEEELPATGGGGGGDPSDAYEDVLQVTSKRRREPPQGPGADEHLPGAG